MADRPINLHAHEVNAIREGRQTQVRRVLTGACDEPPAFVDGGVVTAYDEIDAPYRWPRTASVGDRLWVREVVACGACAPNKPSMWSPSFWRREQGTPANPNGLWYRADGLSPERTITERGRWRPSIHMPRWASRLTLIVTDVRVQRLQEISATDIPDEGVRADMPPTPTPPFRGGLPIATPVTWNDGRDFTPEAAFRRIWNSINAKRPGCGWDDNPWIVALTFRAIPKNIDQIGDGDDH